METIATAAFRRRVVMACLGLLLALACAVVALLRGGAPSAAGRPAEAGLAARLERLAPPPGGADTALARGLPARAVLTGIVVPAADGRLHVQLQLREPASGTVVWRFDEHVPRTALQALLRQSGDQ